MDNVVTYDFLIEFTLLLLAVITVIIEIIKIKKD